ncbi:MAG: hypothetical protein J5643_00230 [Lachnospiraceae bacterium]|nr:hypothetical protein [Lachnospiraceae bacterium]
MDSSIIPNVGHKLADVPFDLMLMNVGTAIAKAQFEMDQESISILQAMCTQTVSLPALKIEKGKLSDHPIETSMIGAGFQPTFYQFAETIIEIKMTINVAMEQTEEKEVEGTETTTTTDSTQISARGRVLGFLRGSRLRTLKKKTVVTTTPIDATYTNKYNYNQEGSSLLRTRIVPVPPNTIVQKQLEMRAQAMQLDYELQLKEYELYIEMQREKFQNSLENKLEQTAEEINTEIQNETTSTTT